MEVLDTVGFVKENELALSPGAASSNYIWQTTNFASYHRRYFVRGHFWEYHDWYVVILLWTFCTNRTEILGMSIVEYEQCPAQKFWRSVSILFYNLVDKWGRNTRGWKYFSGQLEIALWLVVKGRFASLIAINTDQICNITAVPRPAHNCPTPTAVGTCLVRFSNPSTC